MLAPFRHDISYVLEAVHRPEGVPPEEAAKSCGRWQQQRARNAPYLYAALAVRRHQARRFCVACPLAALRRKAQARDSGIMADKCCAYITCHTHRRLCRQHHRSVVRDMLPLVTWKLATLCALVPSCACCMSSVAHAQQCSVSTERQQGAGYKSRALLNLGSRMMPPLQHITVTEMLVNMPLESKREFTNARPRRNSASGRRRHCSKTPSSNRSSTRLWGGKR